MSRLNIGEIGKYNNSSERNEEDWVYVKVLSNARPYTVKKVGGGGDYALGEEYNWYRELQKCDPSEIPQQSPIKKTSHTNSWDQLAYEYFLSKANGNFTCSHKNTKTIELFTSTVTECCDCGAELP